MPQQGGREALCDVNIYIPYQYPQYPCQIQIIPQQGAKYIQNQYVDQYTNLVKNYQTWHSFMTLRQSLLDIINKIQQWNCILLTDNVTTEDYNKIINVLYSRLLYGIFVNNELKDLQEQGKQDSQVEKITRLRELEQDLGQGLISVPSNKEDGEVVQYLINNDERLDNVQLTDQQLDEIMDRCVSDQNLDLEQIKNIMDKCTQLEREKLN